MIRYNPQMVVYHAPAVDVLSLLRRRLRYGEHAYVLRKIDRTLPGSAITRLGPLAAPAYLGYKAVKDLYSLSRMVQDGVVNPRHAFFLIPALFLFRLLDSVGIIRAQMRR